MKEIRIHGRGGQGAVTSSQVLAIAAFHDGKFSQAFPAFGVERRGAPVQSFTRISEKKIDLRQHVYSPDYVIVLDPSLLEVVDVTDGLKKEGMLIVNSDKTPKELGIRNGFEARTIDITKVALEVIGKPFVNIAALGAFAATTGEISLRALKEAIDEGMNAKAKGKVAELNKQACERLYKESGGK